MNSEILIQRAQLLLSQHRHQEAADQLRQAMTQTPDSSQVHALLAICLSQDKDQLREATRVAEQAVHLGPDFPFAHYTLSIVLSLRKNFPEALTAIDEAISLDPYDADYFAQKAAILSQTNKWKLALEAAETGLELDPEDLKCAQLRSLALERVGRTHDALSEAERAITKDPDSGSAHASRGWALLQTGDYRQSQVAFREALRLEPTNEFARQGMIQALNSNHFVFRMIFRFYSAASRMNPKWQMGLIIGMWFGIKALNKFAEGNPGIQPYVMPIVLCYLLFVFLSWLANPLFNSFLRLHSFGKFLLSKKEILASNIFIGVLTFGLIMSLSRLVLSTGGFTITGLLLSLYMLIPISLCFHVDSGWPVWVTGAATAVLGALYLYVMVAIALDWGGPPVTSCLNLFFLGILGLTLSGQFLMTATVRR